MAKKLVLHIGAAKTGSSALQSFLRVNKERLREKGVIVPDRNLNLNPNISGNHVMTTQDWINKNDNNAFLQAFQRIRSNMPDHTSVLISAENLSNIGCHRFFKQVVNLFDETTVVFYIRRQDDLIASSWQQWASKGESDLGAWVVKALRKTGCWEQIIAGWEDVVGANSMKVRVFERSSLVDGDLFHDFLNCLNIDCIDAEWNFELGNVNPSYSNILTPLVAGNRNVFENVHDSKFYKLVEQLTGDAYIEKRKISLLSKDMRESILFYFGDMNQRVCQKYFPGKKRLFEDIDHSKYDYISAEELNHRQMQFLTEVSFRLMEKALEEADPPAPGAPA